MTFNWVSGVHDYSQLNSCVQHFSFRSSTTVYINARVFSKVFTMAGNEWVGGKNTKWFRIEF